MKKVSVLLLCLVMMLTLVVGSAVASPGNGGGNGKGNGGGNGSGTSSINSKAADQSKSIEKGNKEVNQKVQSEQVKGKVKNEIKQLGKIAPERQQKVKKALDQVKAKSVKDYADTQNHWAVEAVKKAKALGIVKGYDDGTFRPDVMVSNVEVTIMAVGLAEALGTADSTNTNDIAENETVTTPVPDWAKPTVQKASQLRIININRFHSQVQASRVQSAIMLAKALKLEPVVSTDELPFPDVELLSSEDIGYLVALKQEGILKGDPNGKFNPNSSITRAEICAMIAQIAEQTNTDSDQETSTGTTTDQNTDTGSTVDVPATETSQDQTPTTQTDLPTQG